MFKVCEERVRAYSGNRRNANIYLLAVILKIDDASKRRRHFYNQT
jgi:hypothetical protein